MIKINVLNFSLTAQILIGMLLGIFAGWLGGNNVIFAGALGKLFIQLIKAIAVPLVFLAIIEAILSTPLSWKSGRRLLTIAMANAIVAAAVGLSLSNLIHPGKGLQFKPEELLISQKVKETFITKEFDFTEFISGHLPKSLIDPFIEGDILGVVLLSLLLGFAGRQVRLGGNSETREIARVTEDVFRFLLQIFEQILGWLVRLTPLAVFGVTAKTVAEYGLQSVTALSMYLGVGLLGLAIQIIIIYQSWIYFFAGIPLRTFWRAAKDAVFYAVGTNSSLATLPLTLSSLDNLKIEKSCSRLGACVGTNLNNDGIILYEAMAVLFVAQAYGIELTIFQQISAVFICLAAAAGVAGVPEAGIVSLSLVLTSIGLPLEILPLLLTIDWIIARGRSVTNVLSDMTVAIALDAWAKKCPEQS